MTPSPADPSARAFTYSAYRYYWYSRVLATFAVQVISVSLGWMVYDITRDPLSLGLVGLVQFVPALVLVLVTGSVADRYSRRKIMMICLAVEAAATVALLLLSWSHVDAVWPIYAALLVIGIGRAFFGPAMQALVPNLVPTVALPSAIALNTSSWQLATIIGPVLGGLLYGIHAEVAFGTAFVMFTAAIGCVMMIPRQPRRAAQEPASWETVVAGFKYVRDTRIVLGAISLDLFAVLLGGATALMPIFARDILDVGPLGLGLLRAGPGIGAIAVALYLAWRPIQSAAGIWMFLGVAVFGAATIAFGISVTPWFSIAMLILMGAADMISVYVRETLIQLATPDDVRGRVNAVNMVFVGASNELGEFRAGLSAAFMGTVPAVVVGGIGTLLVAGLWAKWFPELRRAERLDGR